MNNLFVWKPLQLELQHSCLVLNSHLSYFSELHFNCCNCLKEKFEGLFSADLLKIRETNSI